MKEELMLKIFLFGAPLIALILILVSSVFGDSNKSFKVKTTNVSDKNCDNTNAVWNLE